VILPSLGESVTEGIVTRWMKQVGDPVERDEPLYEISTDKVDSEMPAPASGVLVQILVPEGDTVAVGATLAIIGEDGTAAVPPASAAAAEPVPAPPAATAAPATAPAASWSGAPGAVVTSPFVRQALASSGLTSDQVAPTGPGGRITRDDVAAAAAARSSQPAPPPPAGAWAPVHSPAVAFVAMEARYDEVERALSSEAARAARAEGVDLDATVIALRAAVEALADHPELNAWVSAGELRRVSARNVGIDVEIAEGLVAPVIHEAEDLTVRGLARRMAEVTERAVTGALAVEDLMGATFSISRLPDDAVVLTIPALRPPQVAALSIGAIRRQPVVSTRDGVDTVGVGSIGILGLAYDSTAVSPSQAAAFLARLAALLEQSDWTAQL